MPVEVGGKAPASFDGSIGAAYLAEARATLANALAKIEHCLAQLTEDDITWRAFESHNSIQNIVLHLCGNLRQWIVHGVAGAPDERNRPAEFSDRRPIAKAALVARLRESVSLCDAALEALPPAQLLERRTIQGFEVTGLAAIFDSVSHFVGHTHQIVYITRLRLGDAYRFQWTPASAEQGAPPA